VGEIGYAASFIEFCAEEAKRPNIEGVTSHLQGLGRSLAGRLAWQPLITWNFPCAMLT
jgi:aspartate-semialdehyde dehydrogenase